MRATEQRKAEELTLTIYCIGHIDRRRLRNKQAALAYSFHLVSYQTRLAEFKLPELSD